MYRELKLRFCFFYYLLLALENSILLGVNGDYRFSIWPIRTKNFSLLNLLTGS